MKTSFERMSKDHSWMTDEFADMTTRELPTSELARRSRIEKFA